MKHEPPPLSDRSFALLLAALTGLTALSIDMSLPAMPQLQRSFQAGASAVQLTLSLFLLGYALGQLLCGPLSDRLGRRPVLLMGLGVFALAGFACAASRGLALLVAARLVQGLGASSGPILARAIVRDRYESQRAADVLSQITQVMVLAPLLAPVIGGYLLVYLGWPAIFVVLGGTGLLLGAVCCRYLPETLPEGQPTGGGLGQVRDGFRTILSHPASLRYTFISAFAYAGMFAYISGSPFVFIDGFGVARQHFGFLFGLTAASLMAGATVNRRLLGGHQSGVLLRRGVQLLFGSGALLACLAWLRIGGIAGVVLPMMGYLFSLGLVQPNATAAAMAPHGRLAGVASSLMGGLQTLGGALAGYTVSAFYDRTPRSLATTVGLLAALAFLTLLTERPETTAVTTG